MFSRAVGEVAEDGEAVSGELAWGSFFGRRHGLGGTSLSAVDVLRMMVGGEETQTARQTARRR